MADPRPTGISMGELEWFIDPDGAFGEGYFETQEVILTPERTHREVDFVIAHGDIKPGDAILDIPCGHGRHAVVLARRGFEVTGVDLSPAALGRALATAEQAGVRIRFLQEDMRTVAPEGRFDLALNLYNSIGYGTEADDREVLRRIAASLKPDGHLIMDNSNFGHIVRTYEKPEEREGKEYVCESAYRGVFGQPVYNLHVWSPETRRVLIHAIWQDEAGEPGTWKESLTDMRVYTQEELEALLESAGMRVVETWGGFDGSKYDPDQSKQLVIKAALQSGSSV